MPVFGKLCTPAFVYFVIGIVSIVAAFSCGFGIFTLAAKFIMVLVWTWFLNYLCFKNFVGLAWFLVVLPFIFMGVMVLFAMDAADMKKRARESR